MATYFSCTAAASTGAHANHVHANARTALTIQGTRVMLCLRKLIAILMFGSVFLPAYAAGPALQVRSTPTKSAGLRGVVAVQIDGLDQALTDGALKPSDVNLYLDGHNVSPGAPPPVVGLVKDQITFALARTPANKAAWNALLGSPTSFTKTNVPVGVALAGASNLLPDAPGVRPEIELVVLNKAGFYFALLTLAVALVLLLWLAWSSDILRDSEPYDFGGATRPDGTPLRRTFSLAQTQMAWWFFIVLGAYMFLYAVTGEVNAISTQALTLMGIGVGTALGASMIERTKSLSVSANAGDSSSMSALAAFRSITKELADNRSKGIPDAALGKMLAGRNELARQIASQNFFHDILTDADGISLHRFQAGVWTIVLGAVFVLQVYRNLEMPEFDGSILALLGISAGTYLGFKIPERPA